MIRRNSRLLLAVVSALAMTLGAVGTASAQSATGANQSENAGMKLVSDTPTGGRVYQETLNGQTAYFGWHPANGLNPAFPGSSSVDMGPATPPPGKPGSVTPFDHSGWNQQVYISVHSCTDSTLTTCGHGPYVVSWYSKTAPPSSYVCTIGYFWYGPSGDNYWTQDPRSGSYCGGSGGYFWAEEYPYANWGGETICNTWNWFSGDPCASIY
jgi:hypothetical protein